MPIVVDSNIWIALLDKNDTQHQKAIIFFENVVDTILIPEYIAIEVCTIIKQHVDKQTADRFILKIEKNPDIHFIPSDAEYFSNLLHFFLRNSYPSLSFIDISLLYLSQFHTVHTFDKKLASAIKKTGRG